MGMSIVPQGPSLVDLLQVNLASEVLRQSSGVADTLNSRVHETRVA